jgi:hypothetical protein
LLLSYAAAGIRFSTCWEEVLKRVTINGESGMVWTTEISSHLLTGGVVSIWITRLRSANGRSARPVSGKLHDPNGVGRISRETC